MYHPPVRPGTAIKVVGASLLAKGSVQPPKVGREQCGSPPRSLPQDPAISAEHGRDSQTKKSPLEGGVEVRAWQLAKVYSKARPGTGLQGLQQDCADVRQQFAQALGEAGSSCAVDHAVIVGQRQRQHQFRLEGFTVPDGLDGCL
ncbi:hypothetical protein ALQ91_100946 [Pseudomonas syringae pv. syringae]|nr:hypothetical protein ALQ91_100946 [Pseudomonas syringae pv. syringae]